MSVVMSTYREKRLIAVMCRRRQGINGSGGGVGGSAPVVMSSKFYFKQLVRLGMMLLIVKS